MAASGTQFTTFLGLSRATSCYGILFLFVARRANMYSPLVPF